MSPARRALWRQEVRSLLAAIAILCVLAFFAGALLATLIARAA